MTAADRENLLGFVAGRFLGGGAAGYEAGIYADHVVGALWRAALAAALVLLLAAARVEAAYGPTTIDVAAWTIVDVPTRFPASGTYDTDGNAFLSGILGLNPNGPYAAGTAIVYWTEDVAGTVIVGSQGIPLTSQIPSAGQFAIPNQGPRYYVQYIPLSGPNALRASLRSSTTPSALPEIPPDTLLITERDQTIGPNQAVMIYPADYFAGEVQLALWAPAGITATLWGMDLTGQWFPVVATTNGSKTAIAPMGTWGVVIDSANAPGGTYSITATPNVVGKLPQ